MSWLVWLINYLPTCVDYEWHYNYLLIRITAKKNIDCARHLIAAQKTEKNINDFLRNLQKIIGMGKWLASAFDEIKAVGSESLNNIDGSNELPMK